MIWRRNYGEMWREPRLECAVVTEVEVEVEVVVVVEVEVEVVGR